MARVEVERTLAAPIEDVFELLSNHEGYTRFRGFSLAELVREGEGERNGVGALRRLHTGGLKFDEEITAFERPTRMDYVIREVNAPLQHEGASIVLSPAEAGTRVRWTSTSTMRIPLVGGLAAAVASVAIRRGFVRVLEDVERLAREAAGSA
jgi:uncharacterized protein YndB with AHSA1/START domain